MARSLSHAPESGGKSAIQMAEKMSDHDDTRAHKLREDYHAVFGGDELPVPVESIAEDLLGLAVEARDELAVSGMLLPPERRILVNAAEPEPRRRFAIATNWAIGSASALRGRLNPSTAEPMTSAWIRAQRRWSGRRTSSPRTSSCPSRLFALPPARTASASAARH